MIRLDHKQKDFKQKLDAFCAQAGRQPDVEKAVSEILAEVKTKGDAAVLYLTAKFDHAKLTAKQMRIGPETLDKALKALPAEARKAVDDASKLIRDFHKKTVPKSWEDKNAHGAKVGEKFFPIKRCGLYIPGGQTPLLSTVLMTVIPAQLAGVPEIVVCTPPGPNGQISPLMLGTLAHLGVKEVYAIGGVQAIASMGYGTETVPAVDKLFGPGNAYVTEAKRQMYGTVGVDLLPGPSEVLVIADLSSTPEFVAIDLLAQAEHGTGKEKVYLVAVGDRVIDAVEHAIEIQLTSLPNATKLREILAKGFCAIQVPDYVKAAELANFIAPEHIELQVADKELKKLAASITTAGAMLIGHNTPTVLGDFTAGPSHTLPTGRTGRFFSGLQVSDFMRRTSIVEYDLDALRKAAPVVAAFASMEKLEAHGRSLTRRLEALPPPKPKKK